jgi:hypothetical protein
MSIVAKFKNTDAYMKSFSKRLVELLRIELERNRTRSGSRGSYSGKINDTGELARSLKSMYQKTDSGFSYDIRGLEYGKAVDEGRKGGRPPSTDVLIPWIQSKPIRLKDATGKFAKVKDKQYRIKQLAFAIQKKIRREGIRPTNFIGDAIEIAMQQINSIAEPIEKDIHLNLDEIFKRAGYTKKGDDYIIE